MFAFLGLVVALLALGACAPLQGTSTHKKLLLVSFDGFRWNYDQDVDTPNLDAMARDGVKARYMTPAFVTQTSPCHFTLLTGKYIENHGVIHNMWFNTSTGQKLPYYNTQRVSAWWDNGSLPIWITAQRQGLKTASLFFPGGNATYRGEEVNIKRVESSILHKYDNETEWRENIDLVMKWFTKDNLDFVALYFGEPDSTGHKHGPESQRRKEMISQVDRTVGYLRLSIKEHDLNSALNLIITSDHGMETVIKQDEIFLRKIANFSFQDIQFELVDYGPQGLLVPKPGKLEQVYEALKDAHPKLHVYKKEEFPERFHYANNTRITPLVLYGDPGYVIHGRIKVQINKGEHGFDNEDMNMKTIFRAEGPAFKRGLEVEPFESVNVYALLCKLLEITPEPNDGSLNATQHMLLKSAVYNYNAMPSGVNCGGKVDLPLERIAHVSEDPVSRHQASNATAGNYLEIIFLHLSYFRDPVTLPVGTMAGTMALTMALSWYPRKLNRARNYYDFFSSFDLGSGIGAGLSVACLGCVVEIACYGLLVRASSKRLGKTSASGKKGFT